ncbi:MAG: radical SAM protein [Desulfurococcaceae archaeon TW002]
MRVRASLGTLALLGLVDVSVIEKPTTAYLLLHSENGCMGECVFCPQSRLSMSNKDLVSRVPWPEVELEALLSKIKTNPTVGRICIQTVIKKRFLDDVLKIVSSLRNEGIEKPVSVSTTPISKEDLRRLRDLGVDKLGIGFDASTPEVFRLVRKPYSWEHYLRFLSNSIDVFGPNNVYVHLIYGLGENDVEFFKSMKFFKSLGVNISLFSFTPVRGTPSSNWRKPDLVGYRKMQILRYLMDSGLNVDDYVRVEGNKLILSKDLINNILSSIDKFFEAFLTYGCPSCNRPFYNESVRGPYYNYPSKEFLLRSKDSLVSELKQLLNERG